MEDKKCDKEKMHKAAFGIQSVLKKTTLNFLDWKILENRRNFGIFFTLA